MINFLTYIYGKLSSVADRVKLEKAKQSTPFPYVTYKLPTSTEEGHREDFILEVDIWDNNSNTFNLEQLTTSIDKALNRETYIDSNIQVSIYRINRLMIPDTDETIRRRQLRYQCKVYFR